MRGTLGHGFEELKVIAVLALLLTVGMQLAAPAPAVAEEETMPRLLVNTSIKPPLSTADEDGVLDVLLREWFGRVGYDVLLVRLPPARALVMVDHGYSDVEVPRTVGMESKYPNLIMVPEPVLDYYFVGFTRDPQTTLPSWESLCGLEVAAIRGWRIYEKNIPGDTCVTWVSTAQQLFKMLDSGRAQVILHERYSGRGFLDSLGMQGVFEAKPPLAKRPMYLYLHKSRADLVEPLARTLRAMKADGSYDRIMAPLGD